MLFDRSNEWLNVSLKYLTGLLLGDSVFEYRPFRLVNQVAISDSRPLNPRSDFLARLIVIRCQPKSFDAFEEVFTPFAQ